MFYARFYNQDLGANVLKSVIWKGFHVIDNQLAQTFIVQNSINGTCIVSTSWLLSLLMKLYMVEIPFYLLYIKIMNIF